MEYICTYCYGEGKMLPGGPVCDSNGKKVPCMIRYSKSGSIDTTILTHILEIIDTKLGVYEERKE